MKKMMLTAGVVAMLQSGLTLENEGKAMMNESDDSLKNVKPIKPRSPFHVLTIAMQNKEITPDDIEDMNLYCKMQSHIVLKKSLTDLYNIMNMCKTMALLDNNASELNVKLSIIEGLIKNKNLIDISCVDILILELHNYYYPS